MCARGYLRFTAASNEVFKFVVGRTRPFKPPDGSGRLVPFEVARIYLHPDGTFQGTVNQGEDLLIKSNNLYANASVVGHDITGVLQSALFAPRLAAKSWPLGMGALRSLFEPPLEAG